MENTSTVEFPDDQAEWFIAVGDKFRGPFKASEVFHKLQSKEVSWIDFIFREKEGQWIRVADHPYFQRFQAGPPKPKPTLAPPPPPQKVEAEIKWFLFQNEAQTGPYTTSELLRLSAASEIRPSAFVWQEKFTDWRPFGEVEDFRGAPKKVEKRAAPRKPLMAQVYVTNDAHLASGMCRDISVGGMQVLTDQLPGPVGTPIRLNVMPPPDTGLKPFVAEGSVVRIFEDKRGFSFRFTQIAEEAKRSIESYIR